jgi:hypothetical protein
VGLDRRKEVLQIASMTGMDPLTVVGQLIRFWGWCTMEMDSPRTGIVCSNSTANLQQNYSKFAGLVAAAGATETFWNAMLEAGWLAMDGDEFTVPNWDRWLSRSAKARMGFALHYREKRDKAGRRRRKSSPKRSSNFDSNLHSKIASTDVLSSDDGIHPSLNDEDIRTSNKSQDLEAVARWNALAERHGRPKIEAVTETRRKALRARLVEHPDLWDLLDAEAAHLGAWARGQAFLTFDWILKPANLAKLLEGNYRERPGEGVPEAAAKLGRRSSWNDPHKFDFETKETQ